MLWWLDVVQTAGMVGLVIGAALLGVGAWLENRRDAKRAATAHADRYERFLRYLSAVREARR